MQLCTECGDAQDLDQDMVQYLACHRCSDLPAGLNRLVPAASLAGDVIKDETVVGQF